MKRILIRALLFTFLAALLATAAAASEGQSQKIARASHTKGDTAYQRGDDESWYALGINTPIMTGDSISAAENGRVEVDLGMGNMVRLDSSTTVQIMNLTPKMTQVGLFKGHMSIRFREFEGSDQAEVDTPVATGIIWEQGSYRIDADKDIARFGVVAGSLSVVSAGFQFDVKRGEILEIRGDGLTYSYGRLPEASPFDGWCDARDIRRMTCRSARFVHGAVIGYDDLDDVGTWRLSGNYGYVWYPSKVSSGWAPYQAGRWIWQDPYGWTWISYEPWGWAPYHYGRWINVDGIWGWVPPQPDGHRAPPAVASIRPDYSPALVVFVGGAEWKPVPASGGGIIGWFPLAPGDSYSHGWWNPFGQADGLFKNNYADNSVTAVNLEGFGTGVVNRIPLTKEAASEAPIIGAFAKGVLPGTNSLAPYPDRKAAAGAIPSQAIKDLVLLVRSVPPPRPVTFKSKLEEIEKTGKPYSKPVSSGGDSGEPFKPGAKSPEGINVRSALYPSADDPETPKMKDKSGLDKRRPMTINRDVSRPVKKSAPSLWFPGKKTLDDGSSTTDKPSKADRQKRKNTKKASQAPSGEVQQPRADKPPKHEKPPKADKAPKSEKKKADPAVVGQDKEPKAATPSKKGKPAEPNNQKAGQAPAGAPKPPKAGSPVQPNVPPQPGQHKPGPAPGAANQQPQAVAPAQPGAPPQPAPPPQAGPQSQPQPGTPVKPIAPPQPGQPTVSPAPGGPVQQSQTPAPAQPGAPTQPAQPPQGGTPQQPQPGTSAQPSPPPQPGPTPQPAQQPQGGTPQQTQTEEPKTTAIPSQPEKTAGQEGTEPASK